MHTLQLHSLFQVSEVTGVEREAVTNVMNVNDLTLANAATTVPDFTAMHGGFLKVRLLLYFRDFCYVTQLKQGRKLTFEVTPGDT